MGQNCMPPLSLVFIQRKSLQQRSLCREEKAIIGPQKKKMPRRLVRDAAVLFLCGRSLQGHPSEPTGSQPTYYSNTLFI